MGLGFREYAFYLFWIMSYYIQTVWIEESANPPIAGVSLWNLKETINRIKYEFQYGQVVSLNWDTLQEDIQQIAHRSTETIVNSLPATQNLESKIPRCFVPSKQWLTDSELFWNFREQAKTGEIIVFPTDKFKPIPAQDKGATLNLMDDEQLTNQNLLPLSRSLMLSLQTFLYDWHWSHRND